MPRLKTLTIEGYRSIEDAVTVRFPAKTPVILFGPNNTGKSNIVRGLDLLLGETWPTSWKPEDHDFYGRIVDNHTRVLMEAKIEGFKTNYGITDAVARLDASPTKTGFEICRQDDESRIYASGEQRACLRAIVIGADRRLPYQLSYSSKYTWLSKLMRRFHAALLKDPDRVELLRQHFEGLQEIFIGVPEFAKFRSHLTSETERLAQSMEYALQVDLSAYDASNFFHSLRMQTTFDGHQRSLDEMGTGQEQLLAIAFGYAYAMAFADTEDQLVLAIEEPESHLHPSAQEWLASQVLRFANDGLQVVITTHSPYFLNLEQIPGFVRVSREDPMSPTRTVQLGATAFAQRCIDLGAPSGATEETLLKFYEMNATTNIKSGLLSRGLVLVEGDTEAYSLPALMSRVNDSVGRAGWSFVQCGGKSAIPKWVRMLEAFEIPYYVIFDSDGADVNHVEHQDLIKALQVESTDFERAITSEDITVNSTYCVMGKDFEASMRTAFPSYTELEGEARDALGLRSKPVVAQYACQRLDVPTGSPIASLAERLAALLGAAAPGAE